MSDVTVELMRMDGETEVQYVERVRGLSVSAAAAYYAADAAVTKARIDLSDARRRQAHPEEIFALMDEVSAKSKAKGRARYEKESYEYAFVQVVIRRR